MQPLPEDNALLADTGYTILEADEADPFGNALQTPAPETSPGPAATVRHSAPPRRAASRPSSSSAAKATPALAQTEPVFGSGELDEQVRYRHTPMLPSLPPHQKTPNSARVRITVSGSGNPVAVTILHSCGNPAVDTLLKNHILSHWTFHPAVKDGKTVGTNVTTSLNFT